MRLTIMRFLQNNCQSIKIWQHAHTPTANTPKPYGVVKIGDETRAPFNNRGRFRELTVWPYISPGGFTSLDQSVAEIQTLLNGAILTTEKGHRFEIELVYTGGDYSDPDLNAITQPIYFRIPRVGK